MLKDHIAQARLSHPINALPEELLAEILFHAADDFWRTVVLSCVCRHFRTAVLATPEIWANCLLQSNVDSGIIKTIVERSGALPLKAFIININSMPTLALFSKRKLDLLEAVKEILSSSSRITDLQMNLDDAYMDQFHKYLQLSDGFPILQSLNSFKQKNYSIYGRCRSFVSS